VKRILILLSVFVLLVSSFTFSSCKACNKQEDDPKAEPKASVTDTTSRHDPATDPTPAPVSAAPTPIPSDKNKSQDEPEQHAPTDKDKSQDKEPGIPPAQAPTQYHQPQPSPPAIKIYDVWTQEKANSALRDVNKLRDDAKNIRDEMVRVENILGLMVAGRNRVIDRAKKERASDPDWASVLDILTQVIDFKIEACKYWKDICCNTYVLALDDWTATITAWANTRTIITDAKRNAWDAIREKWILDRSIARSMVDNNIKNAMTRFSDTQDEYSDRTGNPPQPIPRGAMERFDLNFDVAP
jgi:hypothetical protein